MLHKSTLRSFLNAVSRFNTGLGSASGLATMLMMMIIVPDVILRATISFTIPLATEIGVLLLICKIFLGMPGAQASRANFHVSVLTELLGERWRKALRLITTLISIGIIGLLAWLTTQEAVYATGIGETSYGIYPFPIWPERIIVAIGFVLLTIQLIADVIRTMTGLPDDIAPEGSGIGPE
ncbi:TRAP transporter small permease subunit [Ferrovibrio xuzhouensis]|uniref:TRAP transporter small permease protein n=1 Tax=Ferrovibrio xuzhouensis TaxID=1576914 RepID=A0ABV7VLK2_9PROT